MSYIVEGCRKLQSALMSDHCRASSTARGKRVMPSANSWNMRMEVTEI